ncbi:PP2C family protein-serine/threonine phosphatase [Streptomyces europaeiscabiei]|uniref:PP2C family protein-serine/threonine phosphatase n=1 Tax=Streptomyces europaeiscabiei TaxID=146819 RepID=UPI0029A30979|nr:SpoIIE family protein phosphatase [Streptomyces europaeiscabiei]MDX2526418.1 SpoIIE family protein phosphatase [Streptomyces europaeiscabiei]MDX2758278.1 SpoIIE family protein phosphatase [Streptomyces europaeiscabiei]MDX3714001.1 SpoIIE family protein phosphatase [Streptomyces europaeiscabiei]MDX3861977.1 SpoIIE family protein phosphatase [Streptomyces europaeiscabiei]MDX3873276.1 SpoIIE family protein phosphatase [Streptomyces europaeiscabiei]
MTRTWHVSSVTDAARARIATARLATAHGVVATDRARLVSVLTAQLRQCLTKGGAWLLTARATTARPGGCRFMVEVTSANRRPGEFRQPWRLTVACSQEGRLPDSEHVPGDPVTLAEALFGADEDAALLLEKLDEQEALVAFHREELHQTNQGVLALHAELDAAGRAQRELFAAEQKAREEAENARGRLTFLADASAALTASLNPDAIVRLLPTLLVPRYARSADVWLFDGEDDVARGGPRPAAAVVAARRGRPQYAADHPGGLPGVDDQPPSALDPARPLLCVPLMTRRAPLGVLTLSPPDDERWDADDAFMLIELARRAGVALENARRFEHNRDIAETLQRALLTELPTTPGLRLAARYLPATRGLNIGGDWYDAFRQPDGGLIAVIGDVTGHGLRAAVMMSQLRTALRAYAVDGKTPGQLLTRLHLFLHHLQPDLYATAVIARFHPQEPTLTWAAAGHPPPVLRSPDGRVRILDAKPGAMLGIPLHQEIADHTVPLPPGSTLALYTDGLVERRAQGIDPGIEQLASALEALPPATLDDDLQESADQLLHPLLDDEHEDDVCLLLCHVHSDAGHIMARPG